MNKHELWDALAEIVLFAVTLLGFSIVCRCGL